MKKVKGIPNCVRCDGWMVPDRKDKVCANCRVAETLKKEFKK